MQQAGRNIADWRRYKQKRGLAFLFSAQTGEYYRCNGSQEVLLLSNTEVKAIGAVQKTTMNIKNNMVNYTECFSNLFVFFQNGMSQNQHCTHNQ